MVLPPALARSAQPQSINSSIPPTAISLDFGDLFNNIYRYVEVANISDQDEVEIGKQINDMLLSQQYNLYDNAQVQAYVDNLGQELVSMSDSRDIPFTFQVVESDEINAFATPGGFVYLTTGLLEAADNQAQVASVLAHEIAHINQRHSVKALKQAAIAQGIAETANLSTNTLAQIGYQLAIDLPRSRDFEYEADSFGLEILQQAGYPSVAFVNFLQKLEDNSPQPEFLRTHPTTSNRIEAITSEVEDQSTVSTKGQDEAAYQNNVLSLL
jgi:predicted Zn-dependent protease